MSGKQSLGPPPVDPARDHVRGPSGARVVLVYGDYEDGSSRDACAAVEAAGARLAFRHLPQAGLAAAVAAEAAAALGAFWPMHDALLRHAGPVGGDDVRRLAAEAGLGVERFERVFGADDHMARLREDVRGAAAAGVDAPPALFLDGERLLSYEPGWLRERLG